MHNIAVINTCDFGSTGKIALGLQKHLEAQQYQCRMFYGRGEKKHSETVRRMEGRVSILLHYLLTRIIGADGYGSVFATKRLVSFLRKIRVDTVYLVSPHGHYLNENVLFRYLVKDRIKVVYIMIDEYAYLGSCAYSNDCTEYENGCVSCRNNRKLLSSLVHASARRYRSKKKYYAAMNRPVFVGPEYTILQSRKTGLLAGQETRILDEAINAELFSPRDNAAFRKELGIDDGKTVLVCVAPYSYSRKGVRYFYELAREFEGDDRYCFVHVGYDGEKQEFPSNMIVFGYESDQEKLARYYSLADLFVFPSLSDTMPNACLEALSCGSPLLCFNISGMPFIADETVGTFVTACDVEQMKQAVLRTKPKIQEDIDRCRAYALQRYDSREYFRKLEQIGLGR